MSEESVQGIIEDEVVSELKDVSHPNKRSTMPDVIAREYAFTPAGAKLLSIAAPARKPDLLYEEAKKQPSVYDMGPENCGKVLVTLRLRTPPEDLPPGSNAGYDEEIPLRMLPYKTPTDPVKCFDLQVCHATDKANEALQSHNRYITSLLSMFCKENGCGTSAGHITLPPPPDNMAITRIDRIDGMMKDKFATTILAVRYLSDHKKICQADYEIADAISYANDVAFDVTIQDKIEKSKGKVRFRIVGSPPCTWSGNPDERDSFGRRVKWSRKTHHTFLSPEVDVVLAEDELIAVDK
jgi:hypothetical protein